MTEKRTALQNLVRRLRKFLVTTIIGGLVIVLPITLFVVLINFVITFITRLIKPIENLLQLPEGWAAWLVDLISFGIVLGAFFIIGLFVQTSFGKQFWQYLETQLLVPLPFYSTLRDTVQQFLGNRDKMPFSEVVAVDVFSNSTRMIGFISDQIDDTHYTVFVPTGPNPTNGFIFCVHDSQIEWLKVKPEDAMRAIIGVGTGASLLFRPSDLEALTDTPEEAK